MATSHPVGVGARYSPVEYWGMVPHPHSFGGDGASVAVGQDDRVYFLARGRTPVFVFEQDGNFVMAWGKGQFVRPHGITAADDGCIYTVDDSMHVVRKWTPDGELLMTVGTPNEPAPRNSGDYFNRPTAVAVHRHTGDLFVTDGYGNSRVHRFDSDGKHIKSWGEPGSGPGQFSLPHDIIFLDDERLLVCDRENFRIQMFDTEGVFLEQWHIHHPLCICKSINDDGFLYVGEMGPPLLQRGVPNLGHRVTILDLDGNYVGRFGSSLPGQEQPDQFISPHHIAVDSTGSVYVADSVSSHIEHNWHERLPRGELVCLHKWVCDRP